jgi:hypothetical protein
LTGLAALAASLDLIEDALAHLRLGVVASLIYAALLPPSFLDVLRPAVPSSSNNGEIGNVIAGRDKPPADFLSAPIEAYAAAA